MTSDLDILRAAHVMMREHGDDAAMQADSMLDKGNIEGQWVWMRILEAIKELQRTEPLEGEATH